MWGIFLGMLGQNVCPKNQTVSRRLNIIGVLGKHVKEKGKNVLLRDRPEKTFRRKI